MILMKNFSTEEISFNGVQLQVAIDETGADWYEAQKNFQEDTLKVVFGNTGVILSLSYDVSALWPGSNSVAEISASEVPDGVDNSGLWVFDGKKIVQRVYSSEELTAQASTKRDSLMLTASAAIAPLQDAVDISDATEDETALLKEWKQYRVTLNRLDLSNATTVVWPEPPKV
ncbi:tail fiber assembly protein [Rahnella aquatilis]|nr:tail fiber assembly protein [Rahnella aquatilis]